MQAPMPSVDPDRFGDDSGRPDPRSRSRSRSDAGGPNDCVIPPSSSEPVIIPSVPPGNDDLSDPSTIAYPDDTTMPNESSAAAAAVSGDSAETIEYPADGAPPPADDGLPPPILPIADSAAPADVTQNAQASDSSGAHEPEEKKSRLDSGFVTALNNTTRSC